MAPPRLHRLKYLPGDMQTIIIIALLNTLATFMIIISKKSLVLGHSVVIETDYTQLTDNLAEQCMMLCLPTIQLRQCTRVK